MLGVELEDWEYAAFCVLRIIDGSMFANFPSGNVCISSNLADFLLTRGIIDEKDMTGTVNEFYLQRSRLILG